MYTQFEIEKNPHQSEVTPLAVTPLMSSSRDPTINFQFSNSNFRNFVFFMIYDIATLYSMIWANNGRTKSLAYFVTSES